MGGKIHWGVAHFQTWEATTTGVFLIRRPARQQRLAWRLAAVGLGSLWVTLGSLRGGFGVTRNTSGMQCSAHASRFPVTTRHVSSAVKVAAPRGAARLRHRYTAYGNGIAYTPYVRLESTMGISAGTACTALSQAAHTMRLRSTRIYYLIRVPNESGTR